MKRVVIVGGGISGLAAAFYLSQSDLDLEIQLLESSNRVGGVLETLHDGPYMIERSADNFATLIPNALQLSQDSGFAENLIHPVEKDRQAFVLNRGRLLPIPAGFSLMQPTRLGSVVTTQTLSLSGKARLLAEYFVGRRSDAGDESLESFVTRRLGKEAYENLVEPIVSGIFTADPQTLSMQATMPQFLDMERKHGGLIRGYLAAKRKDAAAVARRASGARYDQFMAPRDGMSSWISHMQSQLPDGAVRLGESVKELHAQRSEGGSTWRVVTEHAAVDADAVVLATPANATARLLQHVAPQAASLVESVDYASSAVVAMIVERQELSGRIDGFGSIVPRKEGRAALAISYTSNKYPGRVPDGEILLRVFLGGALSPETVDLLDDELESIAAREVKDILGWSGRGLNWQGVIRWKNAMPQYRIGHVERMDEVDQLLAAQPTIALCGAAYRGVGIPQCVRGAKQAAENIIAALRQGEIS